MRISIFCVAFLLLYSQLTVLSVAQSPAVPTGSAERIAFVLKNSLGHHRMFRVEGPGMAYGFTMNRNEKTPQNWPIGSHLYFSRDGETKEGLILTIQAADAGKTLLTAGTEPPAFARKTAKNEDITVRFQNNSLLFQKVALISYKPGETGNGTDIFTLAPLAGSRHTFPVGTRIYLANPDQVNTVMSGGRIDNEKPLLLVKPADAHKTVNLFN